MERPDTNPPKSVLVYTYEDTVGDGLVKLPFVRALRSRFPQAKITWCAGVGPTSYAGVLAPLVDGFLDEVIAEAGLGAGSFDALKFVAPLGGRYFDIVIDTQRVLMRTFAVRRIRHGLFVSGTFGFRLSDRRPAAGEERPRHLVRYLQWLLDLAAPGDDTGWDDVPFPVPDKLRGGAVAALPDGPVYVGIAPGAGDKEKIWPLDNFLALAQAQARRGRVPVFFIGPDEAAWVDRIRAAVPEARFPEREESAPARGPVYAVALAQRLTIAVANDSGAGHMLAAGGVPLVSLFSKHDPGKYAPTAERLEIVDSKNYGGTNPALIPVEVVDAALERLLIDVRG